MPRRTGPLLATLAGLLLAAGCAGAPDASAERDAALRDAIEEELQRDPTLDHRRVSVHVEDGRVALHGGVDTPAESARAEEIARRADGVRSVENDLRVGPGSGPRDRELPIELPGRGSGVP
jgi:hypothetical protein